MHSVSKLSIRNELRAHSVTRNSIQLVHKELINLEYSQYGTEYAIHSHLLKRRIEKDETSANIIEAYSLRNGAYFPKVCQNKMEI